MDRLTQTVTEHEATLAERGVETTNLQQCLLETEWRPCQITHKGGISEITFFRGLPGENFSDWIKEFDLVARAEKWEEEVRALKLPTRLKDEALDIYETLTPEIQADYDQLRTELKKLLQPAEYSRLCLTELIERKQKIG